MYQFYEEGKLEIGIDEVGRGCLFGPVYSAGVIWLQEELDDNLNIKDSKKCSEKKEIIYIII